MAEALLANLVVDRPGIHRRGVRAAERMQPQPDRTLCTSFNLFAGPILPNYLTEELWFNFRNLDTFKQDVQLAVE
jgi:hypothetical protein